MSRRPSDEEQNYLLARSMRRLCNGAFGNMSREEYEHRAVGTAGEGKR